MARWATYTKDELTKAFPALAEALDKVIEADKGKFKNFSINYCGKYTRPNGSVRRIQLGQAVEILQENGYCVDIKISKP